MAQALRTVAIGLLLTTGSCTEPTHDGAVQVSVIADAIRMIDPDRASLTPPGALLASATATGLVAFDAQGQVEPALAESWIVTSDGASNIFRIREARWPDGTELTGEQVAASLNRAIARSSRNALKPLLSAVDTVVGMTGRVVEIRMKVPRPNLLQLLAQPELGIRRNGAGLGPFKATRADPSIRLRSIERVDLPPDARPEDVDLHAERAALAVARFAAGRSDLVTGGTIANWPIVRAANPPQERLRIDPVRGLFGLALVGRSAFLADAGAREALSMAIDRDALAVMLDIPEWTPLDRLLAARLDSGNDPAVPSWSTQALAVRRADAVTRVQAWALGGSLRVVPVLRVALPNGPGMRLLFARLAADWRAIGIAAEAVPLAARDVDLRLIDAVAPNDSANWYLTTTSCAAGLVCDDAGDAAIEASRAAPTLAARAALLAQADAIAVRRASFIALGRPLRWSLVHPSLTGWRENAMAAHPLTALRERTAAR